MNAPRLVSCVFPADGDRERFARLARVLAFTARRHCGHWERQIQTIAPKPLRSALGIKSHESNTQKMEHWYRAVQAAPDGAQILLIDADTMICRPLDDIWALDFDIAYTVKESRFPFNSGVVFLRVCDRVRSFMQVWRDENLRMLGDRRHHRVWRKKYGGINQAALGYALESGLVKGINLQKIPCSEWNCEDSSWEAHWQTARIVHLKSGLRRAVFHEEPGNAAWRPIVARWREIEHAALTEEGRRRVGAA